MDSKVYYNNLSIINQINKSITDPNIQKVLLILGDIVSIPRPSKKEEHIRQYIKKYIENVGGTVEIDNTGNLLGKFPASKGYENYNTVILQAHMDIVCEQDKNKCPQINFMTDGVELQTKVKNGETWLCANQTTLGADNGIGIAMALACLAQPSFNHPALELLMTVDEETGLTGIKGIAADWLKGKQLINLDSEEVDAFCVGCAGGQEGDIIMPLKRYKTECFGIVDIEISGLTGGHSGLDIDKNYTNAISVLVELLDELNKSDVQIINFSGGSKRNAIPIHGKISCMATNFEILDKCKLVQDKMKTTVDPNLTINVNLDSDISTVQTKGAEVENISKECIDNLVKLVRALPKGVIKMTSFNPNLVQTSNNIGFVRTAQDKLILGVCLRSCVTEDMHELITSINNTAKQYNSVFEKLSGYPPWVPNTTTPLYQAAFNAFEQLNGDKKPLMSCVHAGLECGFLTERYPNIEMISIGPDIKAAHSPSECIKVSSIEPTYNLLVNIIEHITKLSN
jgi:dipeptidase D